MVRTRWWLWVACLAFCACEPARIVPECESICGLRFDGKDCDGFREATKRLVDVYSEHVPDACARFDDWIIYRVETEDGSWTDLWGRQVAGLTWCNTRSIEIGSERWTENAYAHEMMHALDCPGEDVEHTGWADWQWDAIQLARNGPADPPTTSAAAD